MLNFLKYNRIVFSVIVIFIVIMINAVFTYVKRNNYWDKKELEIYNNCLDGKYDNADDIYLNCDNYKEKPKKRDVISTFGYISHNDGMEQMDILAPLLIMLAAASIFHKYIRNGYLKNAITRIEYKKALKKVYFKSLKVILIIPFVLILLLIICLFISNNFDYAYGISHYGYDPFGCGVINNFALFFFFYFLNFILHGIFWVNFVVYNTRYNKNFILCVLISYIEYIMLLILLENIQMLIAPYLSISEYLILPIIWTYSENITVYGETLFSFIIVFVSSYVVYKTYKNKELVLVELSK